MITFTELIWASSILHAVVYRVETDRLRVNEQTLSRRPLFLEMAAKRYASRSTFGVLLRGEADGRCGTPTLRRHRPTGLSSSTKEAQWLTCI